MGQTIPELWPTPNRKTRVQFDLNNAFVSEPAFSYGRTAKAMFRHSAAAHKQLRLTSGWGLRPYHEMGGVIHERIEADDGLLTPESGTLVTPGDNIYFETTYSTFWNTTETPGVLDGASGNLSNPGSRWVRKIIPAGSNWNAVNLPDQNHFPFTPPANPYGLDSNIAFDRIALSVDNDSPERGLYFFLHVEGSGIIENGELGRLMFVGPAGKNRIGTGTGQYALSFATNDRCILYECPESGPSDDWLPRMEFGMPIPSKSENGKLIGILIDKPNCIQPDSPIQMGFRFFSSSYYNTSNSLPYLLDSLDILASSTLVNEQAVVTYVVPGDGLTPTINSPIRVDMRRDLMYGFRLMWEKYPITDEEIIVDDAPFRLPFLPKEVVDEDGHPTHNFYLTWRNCKPNFDDICEFSLRRCDTGDELDSLDVSIGPSFTNVKLYAVPLGVTDYFVRYHVKTSSPNSSPLAFKWHVEREQVTTNTGQPLWEIGDLNHPLSSILRVSIKGTERDLSHSSATIELSDRLNKLTELRTRAGMPMRIMLEDHTDPENVKQIVPFFGFMDRADAFRGKPINQHGMSQSSSKFPVLDWSKMTLMCRGAWQLLEENFVETPFASLFNEKAGRQYMVKELIRLVLSHAGWKYVIGASDNGFDGSFDINDGPIYASQLDFSKSIDMLDKISDVIKTFARDYLSQFLWLDANTSISSGVWRLKDIPTSPYTNVAAFTMDGPSDGSLIHYAPSYGTFSDSGNDIPILPIEGGTVSSFVKYPEANWLQVSTIQALGSGHSSGELTSVIKWDPISFNYNGTSLADPTQPEYLGRRLPIYVIDPALGANGTGITTQAALNALATRIARLTFKAVEILQFRAPIPFIPHEDYEEGGSTFPYRDPRFYDPVRVISNGGLTNKQYLIRNCSPDYKQDGIQYAMYTLERPREGEDAP